MIARMILAVIALAGPLSVVFGADDPAQAQLDRERRVRVALALATAPARAVPAIAPAPRSSDCGLCRADLDAVRDEARKTGKPIVLFIGGCYGRAAELAGQSVILARADSYDVDGQGAKKRIVIIARDGETESASLRVADTLPPDAKADAVRAVVRQAQGMAFVGPKMERTVRKLDWRI